MKAVSSKCHAPKGHIGIFVNIFLFLLNKVAFLSYDDADKEYKPPSYPHTSAKIVYM